MIIQYTWAEDELSARLLQHKLGGTIVFKQDTYMPITDDTVIVGGQISNPTYQQVALANPSWIIYPQTAGNGFINTAIVNGHKVYGVAGWNREDTITAVAKVLSDGLPNYGIYFASGKEFHYLSMKFNPTYYDWFATNRIAIVNKYTQLYGATSEVLYSGIYGNTLEIVFETHSPFEWKTVVGCIFLAVGLLLTATGILTPLGLVIVGIAASGLIVADMLNNKILPSEAYNNCIERQLGLAQNAGVNVDYERILQVCHEFAKAGAEQESELTKALKTGLYVMMVGAGVYVLLAYGLPALKKLSEKKSGGK